MMTNPGAASERAERRAALNGMLWLLAGLGSFGFVHLLELLGRALVVTLMDPQTDPGTPTVVAWFSESGLGGAWANAFLLLALGSSILQALILWKAIDRGRRPGSAWIPLGLGLSGVALGGLARFASSLITVAVSEVGMETLASYSFAHSIAGSVFAPSRLLLMCGALIAVAVLMLRERPKRAADPGPYRGDGP